MRGNFTTNRRCGQAVHIDTKKEKRLFGNSRGRIKINHGFHGLARKEVKNQCNPCCGHCLLTLCL